MDATVKFSSLRSLHSLCPIVLEPRVSLTTSIFCFQCCWALMSQATLYHSLSFLRFGFYYRHPSHVMCFMYFLGIGSCVVFFSLFYLFLQDGLCALLYSHQRLCHLLAVHCDISVPSWYFCHHSKYKQEIYSKGWPEHWRPLGSKIAFCNSKLSVNSWKGSAYISFSHLIVCNVNKHQWQETEKKAAEDGQHETCQSNILTSLQELKCHTIRLWSHCTANTIEYKFYFSSLHYT